MILPKYRKEENVDFYFIFRGFLLLCYEPQYKRKEILNILQKENASIKAIKNSDKLISTYIGLEELKKQGLVITDKMKKDIKRATEKDDISWLR